MKIIRLVKYYASRPSKLFFRVGSNTFLSVLNDEIYLKMLFKERLGYSLNLDDPKTFNEKLNWIKLNDRKPIYTTMVDKCEAKKYVASIIGDKYIIPTIGVWEKFEDINFDKLPNQFVLKCTHDSGGLVICREKATLDIDKARHKINRALKENYYLVGREWPYKNIKPRIIAEKYMADGKDEKKALTDYKFYTMNGKVRAVMIVTDRGVSTKADYFDRNFNRLNFTWGYPNSGKQLSKPANYEKMIELAEQLAVETIEVRVDFYDINGDIYFGELTFFDGSGLQKIEPIEWDYKLGSWLELNISGVTK